MEAYRDQYAKLFNSGRTVVVLAVIYVGVVVLALGRTLTLDGSIATALAICTGVLVPLLPVAALAWVEPDAPAEG